MTYEITPEQIAESDARIAEFEAIGRWALQRMRSDMTDAPDYTAMSGADFQRAVGVDPERWAAAFTQHQSEQIPIDVVRWFADAIDAGRRDGQRLARIGEGE